MTIFAAKVYRQPYSMSRESLIRISFAIVAVFFMVACKSDDYRYAEDCLMSSLQALETGDEVSSERLAYGCNYFFKKGSHRMRALSYYARAKASERQGDDATGQWIDDLARGCHEADNINDPSLASQLYISYGIAMASKGWYKSAIPILERGRAEAAKADRKPDVILALMNLSRCYLGIDEGGIDYRTAVNYAVGATEVAREAQLWNEYSKALFALSSCYHSAGMHEQALETAERSARLMEEQYAAGIRKEAPRYSALARAYYLTGQADSAIYYAHIDLTNDNMHTRADANYVLYQVHRDLLADSAASEHYLEAYNALRDSLEHVTPDENIAQYRISLHDEIALKRRNSLILLLALIIVASALVVFLTVYVFRRRITQKQADLDKEKALLKVSEQESEVLRLAVADNEELVLRLKKTPHYLSDEEWEKLAHVVEKMYPGYIEEVRALGLTSNNLRLVSACKLAFSTSSCAVMLGISPSSVTKAKQRLKAKGIR